MVGHAERGGWIHITLEQLRSCGRLAEAGGGLLKVTSVSEGQLALAPHLAWVLVLPQVVGEVLVHLQHGLLVVEQLVASKWSRCIGRQSWDDHLRRNSSVGNNSPVMQLP